MVVVSATWASGAELLVPSQYPTIQSAIDVAVDGDTVIVAPGTYTGPGNRDIDFHGKAITVRSENGPNNCIIDCDGTEAEPHQGFYFNSGEDANSIVNGFTITNGYATYGGGIYCNQSNSTITNCIFIGNIAYGGGGIYNIENSNPTVTNCTFNGNSAIDYQIWSQGYGGGIYNGENSNPIVNNCTFIGNLAKKNGGGICNSSSSPKVSNCTFNGNVAEDYIYNFGYGGGMFNEKKSKPEVTNCTFNNNIALFRGGGMHNKGSSNPTVTKCTFTNNSSAVGGGMYNWDSNPIVNRCIFSDNSAADRGKGTYNKGGGMCNLNSSPIVKNCLFSNNSVQGMYFFIGKGGGMDNDGGRPTVTNCIFSGNSAPKHGGGMHNYSGDSPLVTNCILWNNSPDQIEGGSPAVSFSNVQGGCSGEGNINSDPHFFDFGNNDYHLLPESPCINAGDPNYVAEPNETDLDGLPRVIGGRIDMGAYEFNHRPIADAGPNQTAYAWIDGFTDVNLDGCGSYDDDNDVLDYYWFWTIDGNDYEANDITPTIELPVGEHEIELVVDDGIDFSEPDYCTITVIGAVRGRLTITPCVLETKSHGKWILATLYLPPVADEQVNTEEPLRLYPGGIEAEHQRFSRYGKPGRSLTIALAFFDRQQVIDALEGPGKVEVSVVGRFVTGQYFYGSDTIKIIGRKPR